MSLAAHHQAAEIEFVTAVAHSSYAGTPVKFENAPFKQPQTAWFAMSIIDGGSFVTNLGIGKQIDRHTGLVQVDVLVPELTGSRLAYAMTDFAGKIWRLKTESLSDGAVVRYRTPTIRNLGCQGGFQRICVRVPYQRDEPAQ